MRGLSHQAEEGHLPASGSSSDNSPCRCARLGKALGPSPLPEPRIPISVPVAAPFPKTHEPTPSLREGTSQSIGQQALHETGVSSRSKRSTLVLTDAAFFLGELRTPACV